MTDPRPISAAVQISATPAEVWRVVSDLSRMPEFSPELHTAFVIGTTLLGPAIGGVQGHDAELAEGIRTTLERIRVTVEAETPAS